MKFGSVEISRWMTQKKKLYVLNPYIFSTLLFLLLSIFSYFKININRMNKLYHDQFIFICVTYKKNRIFSEFEKTSIYGMI